jgi:hypothetical protein
LIATRAGPLVAALRLAVGGCSSSAPRPGPSGPGGPSASTAAASQASGTGAATTSVPATTTGPAGTGTASVPAPSSAGGSPPDESLSGLSAPCTAVIDAQVAINEMFGKPVGGGRPLTAAEVATVFDAVGPDIPSPLTDDLDTLHDAATRAVGKSDVVVASILAEGRVADAMAALSDYIKGCSPPTS